MVHSQCSVLPLDYHPEISHMAGENPRFIDGFLISTSMNIEDSPTFAQDMFQKECPISSFIQDVDLPLPEGTFKGHGDRAEPQAQHLTELIGSQARAPVASPIDYNVKSSYHETHHVDFWIFSIHSRSWFEVTWPWSCFLNACRDHDLNSKNSLFTVTSLWMMFFSFKDLGGRSWTVGVCCTIGFTFLSNLAFPCCGMRPSWGRAKKIPKRRIMNHGALLKSDTPRIPELVDSCHSCRFSSGFSSWCPGC